MSARRAPRSPTRIARSTCTCSPDATRRRQA